jgi:hypothetical protein
VRVRSIVLRDHDSRDVNKPQTRQPAGFGAIGQDTRSHQAFTMNLSKPVLFLFLALTLGGLGCGAATAQTGQASAPPPQSGAYSAQEIVDAGHSFFGKTTGGLADAIASIFAKQGQPNAYIVGEEGAGAIVGGVRYGEGTINTKFGGARKIYWQGPSIGFDFGGNGSRVMVLIYNLRTVDEIFVRFPGAEGSAYMIGGLGINYLQRDHLILAPIRTGVGARLGVNLGYLKFTPTATWNPF